MQDNSAFVLMSCSRCQRLHEPGAVDVSHPICPQCAALATRPQQAPFRIRPLAR